jgi:hypothetical protein
MGPAFRPSPPAGTYTCFEVDFPGLLHKHVHWCPYESHMCNTDALTRVICAKTRTEHKCSHEPIVCLQEGGLFPSPAGHLSESHCNWRCCVIDRPTSCLHFVGIRDIITMTTSPWQLCYLLCSGELRAIPGRPSFWKPLLPPGVTFNFSLGPCCFGASWLYTSCWLSLC